MSSGFLLRCYSIAWLLLPIWRSHGCSLHIGSAGMLSVRREQARKANFKCVHGQDTLILAMPVVSRNAPLTPRQK
jgi:hypothetical protein